MALGLRLKRVRTEKHVGLHADTNVRVSSSTSACGHGRCMPRQETPLPQTHTHAHTHTRLTAFFRDYIPGCAGTREAKPIWILLKQETVSGSGFRWAICKSAPCSRQITTPATHHSVFLQAGCPFCRPTNSVKALKGTQTDQSKSCQLQKQILQQIAVMELEGYS